MYLSMLHPITFSIPREKMVDSIPENKTQILSKLIPGDTSTYIYHSEEDYYTEYRRSYFAITRRKAGWDCVRHYEILANGCIPVFINIEHCPVNTLALCPKGLFIQGNHLYDKFKNLSLTEPIPDDLKSEYDVLLGQLLEYTRAHLTTIAIGRYIIEKTGLGGVKKILFLSGYTGPDYLRCLTLHGLKELFGAECHDYPKIPHIYKTGDIWYAGLYGKGMTYTNLLEPELHNVESDDTVEADIRNRKYDMVVYGSYHRGMPFYDLVMQVYPANAVVLLCGEDDHTCNYEEWTGRGHTVFVREL